MKIYSFNGKKRITDNFDEDPSPLYLGQKFISYDNNDATEEEIDVGDEKQIEN